MRVGRVTLEGFQEKAVRAITHFRGRALIADEMGLGKTIEALAWIAGSVDRRPAVVVSPAHLRINWLREGERMGLRVVVLEGRRPRRVSRADVYVVGYDVLKWWVSSLKAVRYVTVVADEAHYVKNEKASRSRAAYELARRAKYRLALTGTPITNKPPELYGVLRFVWQERFRRRGDFLEQNCYKVLKPWGVDYVVRPRSLAALHAELKQLGMIRRLKDETLPLPSKLRRIERLEVDLTEYRKIEAKKPDESNRWERYVWIGRIRRAAAAAKLDAVVKWIAERLDAGEKLIVFAVHRFVIRRLRDEFRDRAVVVYGAVSPSEKDVAVRRFQTDPAVRLFIGQIVAAGTGLTLTSATRVVFAELSWSPADHLQAEDRAHRIGQGRDVEVVYLVAAGTIEEAVCRVLSRKSREAAEAIDGRRDIDILRGGGRRRGDDDSRDLRAPRFALHHDGGTRSAGVVANRLSRLWSRKR